MKKHSASHDVCRSAPHPEQAVLPQGDSFLHSELDATSHATHALINSSPPSTKIKLSLSQLTTMRWSLADELPHLKALGFDGIGLWRPKVSEVGEEAAAEMIRDADVGVASLSFVGGFTGRHGFSYRDAVADGRDAILDAALLGAENVIVVGGSRNFHTVTHCRRLVVQALGELSEFALLHGVKLSLLPMLNFFSPTWTFLHTLDDTLDLLSQVNQPSIGLAFDTYHLWREPHLIERIPQLVPFTNVVQISDSRRAPQTDSDRCFPGEGHIPLSDIMRAFQHAGYEGYFDLQVWSDEGWAKSSEEVSRLCRDSVQRFNSTTDATLSVLPNTL